MQKNALIKLDEKEISCPVMIGTEGEKANESGVLQRSSS